MFAVHIWQQIKVGEKDACTKKSHNAKGLERETVGPTTRKQAKGPGQRYQLLLQLVLTWHQYRLQKQLVPLASGDQR